MEQIENKLLIHGTEVFGTIESFKKWLNTKNIFFDNAKPSDFLSSLEGIELIEDRLTAMELGDNI